MATYIKGDAVANATSYELYEKVGTQYNLKTTASEINFNLDTLNFEAEDHVLVVKAKADGYEDSDYSNEVTYTVQLVEPVWYNEIITDTSLLKLEGKSNNVSGGYSIGNSESGTLYVQNKPVNAVKIFTNSRSGTINLAIAASFGATETTNQISGTFTKDNDNWEVVTVKMNGVITVPTGGFLVINPMPNDGSKPMTYNWKYGVDGREGFISRIPNNNNNNGRPWSKWDNSINHALGYIPE